MVLARKQKNVRGLNITLYVRSLFRAYNLYRKRGIFNL